jgi:hypothetical protein
MAQHRAAVHLDGGPAPRLSDRIEVPEICRFRGIVIKMYFADHDPPHFHAEFGEFRVKVSLDGTVEGRFPASPLRWVLEWSELRGGELAENWRRARERRPLRPIAPLE